ncbi:hypothetical protein KI387_030839 [Taxus chinensis]|uniref:BING4 C-terminal domain-containing protein n=1 Tax=Taxus chinensis TaxID=29808 RepID=A0AA38FEW9_TAXCH|nr:hypothetical protein KI387_030839 [Taxus chinensis]
MLIEMPVQENLGTQKDTENVDEQQVKKHLRGKNTKRDAQSVDDKQVKNHLREKSVYSKNIKDKKLKGKLATTEALHGKAARNAAKVEQENMDTKNDAKNVDEQQVKKYLRGKSVYLNDIKDKKLKGQLAIKEALYGKSARNAAKVEQWLLPSVGGYLEAEGIERTSNFRQENIVREVDLLSSRKAFDIKLPGFGPYAVDYTLSGRHMVIAGRKGHISIMEWKESRLTMELQVRETVRDVKFLHNELFFATAQKKYVYIYDKDGTEIHCLKEHTDPLRLEFLPKHFLLASISKYGVLRYQDTSTGNMVATHKTQLGRCVAMRMNPYNAVLGLGHNNGTVTMWSPNMSTPLASMLCHHGPVTAMAFDLLGHQMVTAGNDGKLKVWDLRKFSPLHGYSCHAKSVDISQRGLLAVGCGSLIEIWKDALMTKQNKPYLKHRLTHGSQVQDLGFCPYEDVLAAGHSMGISSILVPGSGEPNFDTFVANPFETLKQRREKEIHSLLDKLQPEMIMLDPENIGAVKRVQAENRKIKSEKAREADMQAAIAAGKNVVLKKKTKGKNKPSKRYRKKQENIIRAKRPLVEEKIKNEQPNKRQKISDLDLPKALERFVRYVENGVLDKGLEIFKDMPQKNVVSWNAMIAGYAQNGLVEKALKLFHQMQQTHVELDQFMFATILPACAKIGAMEQVVSALKDMYAKCGTTQKAQELFDKMPLRTVVSWNVMISGYAQNGVLDEALRLFKEMPQQDVVSWNTMIAGYAQNGLVVKALETFKQMQLTVAIPNSTTFASILSACAKMAVLEQGMDIHKKIMESGFFLDSVVSSGLVDMYAKCGSLHKAHKLFDKMSQ